MSEVSYRIVVTAGDYSWTYVNTDDPPAFGTALVDGFTLTRGMPDGDLYPAQPDPAVVQFKIIAESWSDVDTLDEGVGVLVQVYLPAAAATPAERFAGRISDLDVNPHKRGVIVNVTAVDFLADLAELPTLNPPGSTLPNGTINHLHNMCTETSLPDLLTYPLDGHYATEDAISFPWGATETPEFTEALEQLLVQWILTFGLTAGTVSARYVIASHLHPAGYLDATNPYVLFPIVRAADTPLTGFAHSIYANQIDTIGTFTRTKAEAIVATDVTWLVPTDTTAAPVPLVWTEGASTGPRAAISTWLEGDGLPPDNVQAVADFYLPDRTIDTGWRADTFTWRLKAAAPGAYLPAPIDPSIPDSVLGQLIDIVGIDPRWSPVGTIYRGVLAGYTLTLENARPTVALDLRSALIV